MVVIRTRVRAASVPVDESRNGIDLLTNNMPTRIISLDDADALTTASRRHDRQFINNVNERLIHAMTSPTQVVITKKTRIPNQQKLEYYNRGGRQSPVLASMKMRSRDDDDDDESDRYVRMMTPVTNQTLRSSSVPPLSSSTRSPDLISGPRDQFRISGYPSSYYKNVKETPANYISHGYYQPERQNYSYNKLSPVADLAIRQAHRNLDRIELELKDKRDASHQDSLPRVPIQLPASIENGPRRRSSSYHGPRSHVVLTHRDVSPSYHGPRSHVVLTHRDVSPRSHVVLTHRDVSPRSHVVLAHRDASPSYYLPCIQPIHSMNGVDFDENQLNRKMFELSNRTRHMDTYVPRMPTDDKYVPRMRADDVYLSSKIHHDLNSPTLLKSFESNFHPVTSYKPPSGATRRTLSDKFGLSPIIKPEVSSTRRKVREVLCKIKGDPNYFDS